MREFALEKPHGRADYLLFVNGQPAGVIEAKPEGTPLVEVEHKSGKHVEGLPAWMQVGIYPLPFIYESTGAETRFTNGYDPEAAATGCSHSTVPRRWPSGCGRSRAANGCGPQPSHWLAQLELAELTVRSLSAAPCLLEAFDESTRLRPGRRQRLRLVTGLLVDQRGERLSVPFLFRAVHAPAED